MELFVLRKSSPRIMRVVVDAPLQHRLEHEFTIQKENWLRYKAIEFDGKYKPDSDELLTIKQFDDIDGLLRVAGNPQSVPMWDVIAYPNATEIKGLFLGNQHSDSVILHTFDNRQVISNRFAMFFDGNTFKKIDGIGIALDSKPAAMLQLSASGECELLFRSLHNARRLFDMDAYYEAATDQEVREFFDADVFSGFQDNYIESNVDTYVRRKITNIAHSGMLKAENLKQIVAAGELFGLQINLVATDDDDLQIVLPGEKAGLKQLLQFLDEDFLESPLSDNKFRVNSKVKVAPKNG